MRLLPCLLLPLALPAPRARADRLTLRDAVRAAIDRNFALASATLDVEVAAAAAGGARGPFDPRLSLTGSAQDRVSPFGGDVSRTLSWSGGVAQRLPTGGDLELRLDTQRSRSFAGGRIADLYVPQLTLAVTHPILRGFGPAVALAPLRKADLARDQAGWRRAAAAADALRAIAQAYWALYGAWRDLAIGRAAVESSRRHLSIARVQAAAAAILPADVLAVEAQIASREAAAAAAERGVIERTIDLRRAIGLEVAPAADPIEPADAPGFDDEAPAPAAAAARARADNPQLRAARLEGAVREIDVEVTRRGRLPELGVTLAGGLAGADTSYQDAFDPRDASRVWSASGSFLYRFGDRAAEAEAERARLERRRADLRVEDLEREVAGRAAALAAAADLARRQAEAAGRAADLAARAAAADEERLAAGQIRSRDLLLAQDEARRARQEHARAEVVYASTTAALQAMTGEILGRHGVAVR